jgi:hypothetical protein
MKKFICLLLGLFFYQHTFGQVTQNKYWTLKKNVTRVEAPSIPDIPHIGVTPTDYLIETFRNVAGKFHYYSDGHHFFYPGFAFFYFNNRPESIKVVAPAPGLILNRTDEGWKFWKEIPEVSTWAIRNHKIKDDWVVIGDGNEIGPNVEGNRWRGNTYFGKIGSKGNINWVKVNDETNMSFYHGITGGDLNGDGLIDIGGSPVGYQNPPGVKTFIQNKDGSFLNRDPMVVYPKDYIFPPFTLEYEDLDKDGIDEIITADYGYPANDKMNHVMVLRLNKLTENFQMSFASSQPTAFYSVRMGATSIKVHDFTGDGIKDLSVAREGQDASGPNGSIEIWRGLDDGSFTAHWSTPIWSERQLMFREFSVFDVNKDGHLDIILRPHHFGSFFRNNPTMNNVSANNGIKLHKLIWLNDGKGKFNHYDKDTLKIVGINVDNIHPYMDGDILHFIGTFTESNGILKGQKAINLTTYDIQVHLNGIDAPNKPDLIFPENNSTGLTGGIEYKWSSTSNTTKYEIQFSTVASFNSFYLKTDTLTQNKFKIPSFKSGDPSSYYWRVRGIGVGGNGEWSSTQIFTRAKLTHDENLSNPITFELHQNFPNPFNPSTQIQFSIPTSSHVKIEVFNSIGKRIKVLMDEMKAQGTHTITFDATSLTSGAYVYRLTTPEFTQTRIMTLVK